MSGNCDIKMENYSNKVLGVVSAEVADENDYKK